MLHWNSRFSVITLLFISNALSTKAFFFNRGNHHDVEGEMGEAALRSEEEIKVGTISSDADIPRSLQSMPIPETYDALPALPTPSDGNYTCSYESLIDEDFENGLNKWYGNLGSDESLKTHDDGVHTGSYLHISRRTHEYQGPMIDLPLHVQECILPEETYFFSAKIKITPGDDFSGTHSECHTSQTSCPVLMFSHMDTAGTVRWTPLVDFSGGKSGTTIQDGQWFDVRQVIAIPSTINSNPDNLFSLFSITGVEPGIDISIDDFKIRLPPAELFPDPENVCQSLAFNGDAEDGEGFTYPFTSYLYKGTLANTLFTKVDPETGNTYFSITNRQRVFDGITLLLNKGCIVPGTVYRFSSRIRLHAPSEREETQLRIRILAWEDGISKPIVENIATTCPTLSEAIGWVTCSNFVRIPDSMANIDTAKLVFIFPNNDVDDVDWDDFIFEFVP